MTTVRERPLQFFWCRAAGQVLEAIYGIPHRVANARCRLTLHARQDGRIRPICNISA